MMRLPKAGFERGWKMTFPLKSLIWANVTYY